MHYVYLLRSQSQPAQTYIDYIADLRARLKAHNLGNSSHTSKYSPWELVTYVALSAKPQALAFERYLKSHS
ncbi:MAG: GIY-YIG nuclease family protein [Opitutaceae bacterium]|nr:GIY-YIG nuclease family protein [Opitutaceae bacterium]